MDSPASKKSETANNYRSEISKKISGFAQQRSLAKQKRMDKKLITKTRDKKFPSFRQFKYLPYQFTRGDKLALLIASIAIAIALSILGYNNIWLQLEFVPKNGGDLTEGLVGAPQHINPILAQTNDVDLDISRLIFSGLMKYNEKLELVPDLAENVQVSEDQKEFTFVIKEGIQWHDGEPFTVDDVIFTIQSIQDENYESPLFRTFQGVRVERIDDRTVRFLLEEPYAAFLHITTVGIIPQHLWFDIPASNAQLSKLNQKPIGTGPYQFASLTKDNRGSIKSYELKKNKNYYAKIPYIDAITFKFYSDHQTAIEALLNKNVESLAFLPRASIEQVKNKRRIVLHNFPLSQLTGIFFNKNKNSILKDKVVRQALSYAIDKEQILATALDGNGNIVDGPILPGFLGYTPDLKKYKYNPQKAADMLLEDDWKLDGDFLTKDGEQLKIKISTVDSGENVKAIKLIQRFWQNIGVNVEVEIIPPSQIQQEIIIPREYEVLLFGITIGYDSDPYPFWHSSQREHPGVNLTSYGNRKTDQLLEEARQTTDPELRSDKYLAFQGIIAEDVPAIFLYSPTYTYAATPKIQGISVKKISIASDRFINVENWYVKNKRSLPFFK